MCHDPDVSPLASALLGALGGILLTALVLVTWNARRAAPGPVEEAALSPGMDVLLSHLRTPAALVGPHDEVLAASQSAVATGIVRGTRLAVADVLSLVREARREHELGTLDVDVQRGGTTTPFAVRAVPLERGRLLVLADDRSAALRMDETRRDFVANVSHELKTPVGAISLLAETIEGAADDPAAVRKFGARLGAEAARLNELVNQIIALSRLQSQDPMLAAEPVDVDTIVAGSVDRCRPLAESRQVTISVSGATGLKTWGDAAQLEVAVTNLVQNAIVYSHEGARVAVLTRAVSDAEDDHVEIAVSDNGIGIAEEHLPRLFERFFRVDYGRSRASGGTGLGLALVKHIVGAHGGTVNVWSKVGQGSTFTLRLPALADEPDAIVNEGSRP